MTLPIEAEPLYEPKSHRQQAEELNLTLIEHTPQDFGADFAPEVNRRIEHWDQLLQANPSWRRPELSKEKDIIIPPENKVAHYLYSNPTIREWGSAMKEAKALIPLQRPYDENLPGMVDEVTGEYMPGIEIDDAARSFFLSGLDAVAIRKRAVVMSGIVRAELQGRDEVQWTSLACGAAIPVYETLAECDEVTGNVKFYDISDEALGLVDHYRGYYDLPDGIEYSSKKSNLIKELMISDKLIDEVGEESQDVIDMMGIFEYFDEDRSAQLLRQAYRLLKPGGLLVAGNMLADRPQIDFNQRGVGWPDIFPRTLAQLSAITRDAGVADELLTAHVADDRVYAVLEIRK